MDGRTVPSCIKLFKKDTLPMNVAHDATQSCNLCGDRDVEVLGTRDRRGDPLGTVICTSCGLIRVDPLPEEQHLREFYAAQYRNEYKGSTITKRKHLYRDAQSALRRFRFLEAVLRPRDRLLGIGSGSGVFVYVLCRWGFNASGIEPDEGNSTFARQHLQVDVRTGFAKDITEEGAFDVVTLHHVLEHMNNPLEELRHIRKLIRPGGHLMMEVPSAEDCRQDPGKRYHKAHLFTFDSQTLPAMVEKAGFKVHATAIAPSNRNITLLARKVEDVAFSPSSLIHNYRRIRGIIDGHKPGRYYFSSAPYRKFVTNTLNKLWEQGALIFAGESRDIIDAVIMKERRLDTNNTD